MVSSDIDYNALEKEVERTINVINTYHINFASKTIKECRYIKTYVEVELNTTSDLLAVIILFLATGVSSIPTSPWYGGGAFVIAVLMYLFLYKQLYKNCRRIVLDAEQRILSETDAARSKPQEEPTNGGNNIDQIEFIKAQLDLLKMKMAGLLGGMLVLVNSILQTIEDDIINKKLFLLVVLFILMMWLIRNYTNYSKKLNEK